MATVHPNRRIERAGANALRAFLEEHNHLVQEISGSADHGEDFYIMLTREGERTGYSITVQVKAGKKYKRARGYAIPVGHHFTNWRTNKVPVIGVVYDTDLRRLFWVNLTQQLGTYASAPRWVPVSQANELCAESVGAFVTHIEDFTDTGGPPPPPAHHGGTLDSPSRRGRQLPAAAFRTPVPLWDRPTGSREARQPQVTDGWVVVRHGYRVRVLDAGCGTERWSATTAFGRLNATGDGAVYVSFAAGRLRALGLQDRRTRWERRLRVRDDLATYSSQVLYVPDADGRLYALATSTGSPVWSAPSSAGPLGAPVLVSGGQVFTLRAADGSCAQQGVRAVVVLDAADGGERWRYTTSGTVVSPAWTLAHGVLYLVERPDERSSVVVALDAGTGRTVWRASLPEPVVSAVVVSDGAVHVSGRYGGLFGISRSDGTSYRAEAGSPITGSPVAAEDSVLVNLGRAIAVFDASTGDLRWRRRLPGLALGEPFVLGGAVCMAHRAGVLAWDIRSHRQVWSSEMTWDPVVQGEPCVADGRLYLTDRGGVVRAFRVA